MDFHFLHAADIHLDRAMRGFPALIDSPPEIVVAPRTAFAGLVDLAIADGAAFVILAGDIYDGDWQDYKTGYFFQQQMGRLNDAGIPVVVLYGNHDAEQAMTKNLVLPQNVHVLGSKTPSTVTLDQVKVALHGQSFRVAATTDNLAASYPPPLRGYINIGVLHTALEGTPPHSPYAPCTLAQLMGAGYDYWALGHVHGFCVLSEDPWVVFPGNLQGLHINEPGARGAVRVSVTGGRLGVPERVHTDVLRWAKLTVDVSSAMDAESALRAVADVLRATINGCEGRHLCVRVRFEGATPAHDALVALASDLHAQVVGQALAIDGDRIWIERVELGTVPASATEDTTASDTVADLESYLLAASVDANFLNELEADLQGVLSGLPLGADLDGAAHLTAVRQKQLTDLAASLVPAVRLRLRGS